jgi:hypothetical protein
LRISSFEPRDHDVMSKNENEGPIGTQPWKYAGKHRLGRRETSDTPPTSGARVRKIALIIGFTAAAAAIIAFVVTVLTFGQPTQHGHTRSLPHTTTN